LQEDVETPATSSAKRISGRGRRANTLGLVVWVIEASRMVQ
jgi:hypothetical protein